MCGNDKYQCICLLHTSAVDTTDVVRSARQVIRKHFQLSALRPPEVVSAWDIAGLRATNLRERVKDMVWLPHHSEEGELYEEDAVAIRVQADAVGEVKTLEHHFGGSTTRIVRQETSVASCLEHLKEDVSPLVLSAGVGEEDGASLIRQDLQVVGKDQVAARDQHAPRPVHHRE